MLEWDLSTTSEPLIGSISLIKRALLAAIAALGDYRLVRGCLEAIQLPSYLVVVRTFNCAFLISYNYGRIDR